MKSSRLQRKPDAVRVRGVRPSGRTFAAPRGGRVSLAGILAAAVLSGCQTVQPRAATSQPAVPVTGNAELMEYIGEQPLLTAELAYRSVYLLAKGVAAAGSFEETAAVLHAEGIIGRQWRLSPDSYMDRAHVGHMVCRALGIRSGLNWLVTGLGRYAWRELQYKGIAGPGSEWGLISGGEFQGILARADEYAHRYGSRDDDGPSQLGQSPTQP